jgi:hypothetical protein
LPAISAWMWRPSRPVSLTRVMADRVQSDMIDGMPRLSRVRRPLSCSTAVRAIIPGALPEDFTNALNEFISEAGATN